VFKKIVGLVLLSQASMSAYSAEFSKEGKVIDLLLRTGDESHALLYVSGLTSAGNCFRYRDHVAISIPKDDKASSRFSMLLAAHMASKNVHVKLNDTKVTSTGACIIQDLRLDKSF